MRKSVDTGGKQLSPAQFPEQGRRKAVFLMELDQDRCFLELQAARFFVMEWRPNPSGMISEPTGTTAASKKESAADPPISSTLE